MTGIRRLPIPPVLAVLAVLVSAPFAAQAATPCTDCCQLPCVEAEIRYALKMQEWYRSQVGIRNLTAEKYEAGEKAKGAELSRERIKGVGALPACAWHFPDPNDNIAMRRWYSVGWGFVHDEKGDFFSFSLKTDPKECTLRESQVKQLREVTACTGIAEAAEKHERFHVTSCQPHKGQSRTVAQIAQDEVAAYDVELKELDNLKKTLEKVCEKTTCTTKHEGGDVKKRLEEELETLKQQLAKRGGRK